MSKKRPPKNSEITAVAKGCAAMWGQRHERKTWDERTPNDQWGWYFEADAVLSHLYEAGFRIRKAKKGEEIPTIWEECAVVQESEQSVVVNLHIASEAGNAEDIERAVSNAINRWCTTA